MGHPMEKEINYPGNAGAAGASSWPSWAAPRWPISQRHQQPAGQGGYPDHRRRQRPIPSWRPYRRQAPSLDAESIDYCKEMMAKAEKNGVKLVLPVDTVTTAEF